MVTRVLGSNTGDFLGGGEDARLGSASPTTNYGGSTTFQVQNSAEFDKSTAVLRQPLPGDFALSTVTAAQIEFYQTDGGSAGTFNVDLYACLRAWVESQCTANIWSTGNNWTTQLGIGSGDAGTTRLARLAVPTGAGLWRTWSDAALLAYFQALADASATEMNLLMRPEDLTSTSGSYVVFVSTEGTDGQRWKVTLTYTPVSSGPTITGPSGAAGAASITHAVNELQNNAGTWSATGGSAWSLTGTDAGLLSISSGGVVTLGSGDFDRETKASYSFNVLRDAVAQAVTLNINNVNEAPTFSGPDISVPGLVVGTPMGSINAALRFADPDSGDTGTYSAVGTWPAGITVSSAGLISGTPTTAGTSSSLRVRRTDGGGLTADSNLFSITVSASSTPVSFTGTVGAQSGTAGSAFSWAGSALASFFAGSLSPFTYNVSTGSLPPGLTLNSSTGVVSGTPTTAGTFNATFRALDTGSNAATSNSVAFTIAAAPPPAPAPGFDFHTAAGCIFGAISGSLVGLAREVGVSITTRVYNATTGALVATLPATATDSNGRLPRLTDAALVSGTNYRLVFVWADGSAYTINMVAS